jgi:hypothetical protein
MVKRRFWRAGAVVARDAKGISRRRDGSLSVRVIELGALERELSRPVGTR